MADTEKHIQHKRSNVSIGGVPKLPTASQIEYGEIAVNYSTDGETLSIKNASNQIVTFKSDKYWNGQVSTLSGNVSTLSGNVSTLGNNVSTISGNVTVLGNNVSMISGDVATLTERVDDLDTKIDAGEY